LSGSTQSPRSAQSRPAQPSRPASTPCPSCSTPAPTPTPSCTCTATPTPTPSPNIPLNDLGGATYKRAGETFGLRGGLYKGSNQRPPHHDMAGLAIAAAITPRGPDGSPTPTPAGKIGVLSIGMCNAQLEFSGADQFPNDAFLRRANGQVPGDPNPDRAKDSNVVLVDAAKAGKGAAQWANLGDDAWSRAMDKITAAGLSAAQIQVVWMEHAQQQPTGDFQTSEQSLQGYITT